MDSNQVIDILKLAWPVIVLQLAVQIWAIVDLVKKGKTKTLSFSAWLIIIILGELIGSILYFILGRTEE